MIRCAYCKKSPPLAGEQVPAHADVRSCPRWEGCTGCGGRSKACVSGVCRKQCTNCGERGHGAKRCPQPKKPDICTACGGTGHRSNSRSCPQFVQNVRHCSHPVGRVRGGGAYARTSQPGHMLFYCLPGLLYHCLPGLLGPSLPGLLGPSLPGTLGLRVPPRKRPFARWHGVGPSRHLEGWVPRITLYSPGQGTDEFRFQFPQRLR